MSAFDRWYRLAMVCHALAGVALVALFVLMGLYALTGKWEEEAIAADITAFGFWILGTIATCKLIR